MSLNVEDTFSSFEEFQAKLRLFQREQCTQFALSSSQKLHESDDLFPVFKYSVLRYVCKQGKRVHESNEGSIRPRQRSFKLGCPVRMNVRLNRPKGKEPFLKVTNLHMQHENHEVSKEIFQLYPEQRRFELDVTGKTVLASVTMKTAEKRDILEKRHGTVVMTQDVYNKERLMLLGRGRGGTDEEKCEEIVREVNASGGYGEVGQDDNGQFLFCCFMTGVMKSVLLKFPECLIMDCTYKVNNYLYPLLTIMVIDGEGHGMPVFHAVLAKEDRHIMEKCLNIFAQQFNSEQTSCFIVDKDMAEIAAIGTVFPGVPINLCHFHVSQAVERYLRKELGRGVSSVKLVRDLFMSQVFTESEDEFTELKSKIKQIVPQSVIDYFETNWWAKRHLWAACCNISVVKFHATTTNAIESYHSKIKKTISEKLSLAKTLFSLLSFDEAKINEARRQQVISCHSRVYDLNDRDEVRTLISQSMTRFGGDLVKSELTLSEKLDYSVTQTPVEGCYTVSYKDRHHQTTAVSCSCSTFGHMQLPCRHIFVLRRHLGLQFDTSLIPGRFSASFALQTLNSGSLQMESAALPISIMPSTAPSYRTAEGRYRKAKSLCDSIANFLAILGEAEFTEKVGELEQLMGRWSPSVHNTFSSADSADPSIVGGEGSAEPPLPSSSGEDPLFPAPSIIVDCAVPVLCDNSAGPLPDEPSLHAPSIVVGSEGSAEPSLPSSSGEDPLFPASSIILDCAVPVLHDNSAGPLPHEPSSHAPSIVVGGEASAEPSLPLPSVASVPESTSWPKMSKLLKPRGRPGTKQSFTRNFAATKGRRRQRTLPMTFQSMCVEDQALLLIRAVSTHQVLPDALVEPEELIPFTHFNDIVMDDKVNISVLKDFVSSSAWDIIVDGVDTRRSDAVFYCGICKEVDDMEYKMIQCEHCLVWFHFHCVGYSSKKKVVTWFCDSCLSS